ncbi:MAG TPA: fused MFS/spermidine synthase [Candidatus Binatia bacterium]
MSARRGTLVAVAACFFLSGLGSLALEVVWTRELRLVFGSTTLAASTILVAYMLGLGLGGLAGGRVAGRIASGVRAYGWFEIAIGAYALIVPWLLAKLPALNQTLLAGLDFWPAAFCRFAIALAVLLLPTLLMGATLPILVSTLTRRDPRIGAQTGLLYGLNTLGAVVGVVATTFVSFRVLGLTWTNRAGALLDVVVGVVALLLIAPRMATGDAAEVGALPSSAASREQRRGARAGRAGSRGERREVLARDLLGEERAPAAALLAVYAVVGFTALLYEVAWSRALAVVFGSSIYAFSSMLAAFLAGIALGSLIFRRWVDRTRSPVALLAGGLVALAVLATCTTAALPHLPAMFLRVVESYGLDSARIAIAQAVMCALVMLPPTLVLGGLFPLVARILADQVGEAGDAVGRVYFANTLGSAAGAFATGFVLLPTLGLRETLALGAALNLLGAALLLFAASRDARRRALALAPLAAAALLLVVPIPFDRQALTRGVFKAPDAELDFGIELLPVDGRPVQELLFYRDGINATVSVHREEGIVALRVNGKVDASSFGDMSTQVLLGQIPLLYGPPAKNVLVIGYASGVTTGSVATHSEVERIDAVEIEPAIVEASRFFDRVSGSPLDDPRVHVVLDDARSFLAATREKYDVIISEPSNPWMSGVSNLFTREFFSIVRRALAPGGRLLQWVQLYALDPQALASIIAAVRAEFPYVYGFADFSGSPDLLLLAMDRPLGLEDLPRWEKLPPKVQGDLQRIGNFSTIDLWSLMRVTPKDVDALVAKAPVVNSDENLFIELGTPWMLYDETSTANWKALVSTRGAILPLLRALGEPMDRDRIGELALAHARKESQAVNDLLMEAGRTGTAIAAATIVARRYNDGSLSLENQLATLDEAVALAPQSFEARLLRAQVREEAGDLEGSLADASRAVELSPGDPRARALRMRVLAKLGRYAEARLDADSIVDTAWAQAQQNVRREAAEVVLRAGDLPRATAMLEALLRGPDPMWSEGWQMLAWAYAQQGDDERARAADENARTSRRNRALGYHRMARSALWQGKPDDAAVLLSIALSADPDYEQARTELQQLQARTSTSAR